MRTDPSMPSRDVPASECSTGAAQGGHASRFLYERERTRAISFPLGGIGTGCIGLSGAGRLIDWEIFNRPAKGTTNGFSHLAVRAEQAGTVLDSRILNGPYRGSAMGESGGDAYRNFGFGASRNSLAGMPHFRDNDFDGRFPMAALRFTDPEFPGQVLLRAFNPFIPCDERSSGLPAAMLDVTFTNPTSEPIDYTLAAVLGHDLGGPTRVRPVIRDGWQGLLVETDSIGRDDPDFAQLLIATDAERHSRQCYLYRGLWYDALEVYWRDFRRPGPFTDRRYAAGDNPGGMIRDADHSLEAGHVLVAPGESARLRLLLAWYVPIAEKYWVSPVWHFKGPSPAKGRWRNWYATQWADVEEVGEESFARWRELEAATECFRDTLYGSTMPGPMLEAAAANLSTLKSPTVLRLEDGTLYGWEGCHPAAGSCEGSCTHVWNYQQAVAFLFPRLARSMRSADFRYNLGEDGGMSFRLGLPLGSALFTEHACADGQLGNLMVLYRDWKLSGDDEWLRSLWPAAKAALAYAWSERNPDRWDPERTGVLHGRQHHTLDMELFGPNAWLSGFYVGALLAAAEMADSLAEASDAEQYRQLAYRGRAWINDHLFNGDYFVQRIELGDRGVLAPYERAPLSLRMPGVGVDALYWSAEHDELRYQMGEGCFIDQLSSQWHAALYGLPEIFEVDKCRKALAAVFRHNHFAALGRLANAGRVLGFEEDSGTIVVAWPETARQPAVSVPYAQETLHGMEYSAGTTMLQYGLVQEAVALFRAVRDRYDGKRRNPWSELECGSNYARSLASWSVMIAASGYSFDARHRHLGFAPRFRARETFRCFWSSAEAWGEVHVAPGRMDVAILHGRLPLASLGMPPGTGSSMRLVINGSPVEASRDDGMLAFAERVLTAGDTLTVEAEGLTLAAATDISGMD